MAAPNPYFINIELYWSDGTRPNQNQIARVKAFDVFGGATTEEGQSGYNPNNGGWYPVYMQNIAAFSPPRDKPSLKFEVWNTAEQLQYSTQVFNDIPCASTVKITIGVGAELVGGSGTSWVVFGTIRHQNGTLLTSGVVRVFDITSGSEKELGSATLGASGTYSLGYASSAFNTNGTPHNQPNLRARVYGLANELLGESSLVTAAGNNQQLDATVPNVSTPQPPKRRVFGAVRNSISLPVSGIQVEAYHVAWTVQGINEFRLGPQVPATQSDAAGNYEIFYDLPSVGTPLSACAAAVDQVNLIVYAKAPDGSGNLETLFHSEVFFDAPAEQRVDLSINKIAATTTSEYQLVHAALSACLGSTDAGRWNTLNQLSSRPDYLAFVARSAGQEENLVRAYVRAWLISGEINQRVPAAALSRPMAPEVIYGLLRIIDADSLVDLLNLIPEQFFDAIVRAVHAGLISASIEGDLFPSQAYGNKSLLDDWRIILSKLLNQPTTWQGPLIALAFPDKVISPDVLAASGVAFGADTTVHNVPMPAAVTAGDLLLVLFANDGSAAVTLPAGWTELRAATSGSTTAVRFGIYAKIATGAEGGTVVNFQTAAAEQAVAHIYHIAKASWAGTLSDTEGVVRAMPVTGSGTTIDPPATPTEWHGHKTLWLACAAHDREFSLTSTPQGYTPSPALRTTASATQNGCTVISARRETLSNTENPGAFVIATADDWVAATVGVAAKFISQATKREAVTAAHFDYPSSFSEVLLALKQRGFDDFEIGDLRFVFEMYEAVGRYFPIVAAVFARKQSQGWLTIRDLAKVPVDGDPGGHDWRTYAYASLSFSQGAFPSDVPGTTVDERARVYAARLHAIFGGVGSTERFTDELAAAVPSNPELGPVSTFVSAHPDFDLERANVDKYLRDKAISLPAADVAKLKQIQRVYRLTSGFDAAQALITAGLDSAVKIARLDEGRFIADYEEVLGGISAARHIHRIASQYASEVMFTIVKYHQNINAAGGLSAVPGAPDLSALDPSEGLLPVGAVMSAGDASSRKFPNWVTLFGNLNQCACKDCQTVLSPGAYLVDLLQFVDGAPKKTLFARRPDLSDIELTCTNTNTVLPYIDLVNEVLEAVVAPLEFTLPALPPSVEAVFDGAAGGSASSRAAIAQALLGGGFVLGESFVVRPSALDAPGATPRYREWAIEDESYRYSVRQTNTTFTVFAAPQTSSNNDSLEVFPEHYNAAAHAELADAVFPFQLPLALAREESRVLLSAKNLTRHQILTAFNVATEDSKRKSAPLSLAYLDLTVSEARAILSLERPAREYWGFSSDQASIARPDQPTLQISGHWVALMSLVPVFLHRSGLLYSELLELLDTEFVHEEAAAPDGLHIAAPSDELIECNYNEFQVAHLNEPTLRRISCFVRLWRKLGWSMREVDRYLMTLEGANIPAPDEEQAASEDSRLVRLSQFKSLVDDLKLPVLGVAAFFRTLDTRRSARNPRSFFDQVFMNGSPSQPEIQDMELIARGSSVTLSSARDLKAHVRAALRLKAEEIDLLWSRFVEASGPSELTLEKLSRIYRAAALSASQKVSVVELFEFTLLTGVDPLPAASIGIGASPRAALLRCHEGLFELKLARKGRVSAAQLRYYLTGEHEPEATFVPTDADLTQAVQALASASQAVASANPEVESPDAVALTTLLGKVIPAEKVNAALTVIGSPTSADAAFAARYFSPFVTDAGAFLAQLIAATDATARYRLAWRELHSKLVTAARTNQAIAVVAELFQVDQPTANVLLTNVLGRVPPGTGTAIEDWKAMLRGGWDSGEASIENAGVGERQASFIASKSGAHRFVVSFAESDTISQNQVELEIVIDGVAKLLTASAAQLRARRREIEFEGVTLRAGVAYAVRFEYTSNAATPAPIDLLLRVEAADPSSIPSAQVVPFNLGAFVKAFKAANLIRGLSLTTSELRYFVEHPEILPLDALPITPGTSVPWSTMAKAIVVLDLNRNTALARGTLLEFWHDSVDASATPPIAPSIEDVAARTGFKAVDIEAVLGLWSGSPPDWDSPSLWSVLTAALRIVRRLDVRAEQISSLLVTGEPSLASTAALRNVLRAQYGRDAWKEIFKPLRDPLRQRERDALVGYLTTRPVGAAPNEATFFDANDLFAHYLIDVEMEPDTLISRVKLALNVVQLFVHRVFLGLEDAAALGELEAKRQQWTWMEKYRVWEANRKVFLFPENWIEPELRDDKTEFFKELEDELLQTPITHETATAAIASYLEKMSEVSNLEIVGSYTQIVQGSDRRFVLHVIGRTRSRSRSFFYRTFEGKQAYDGKWNPWVRVNLEIDANVVAPVFANGRLQLIWPKVVTKERPKPYDYDQEPIVDGKNVAVPGRTEYQAEIRLMWSEYIPQKKKWTKPKISKTRALDENAPTPFQRELGEDEARTENYHLRVKTESNHVLVDVVRTDVPLGPTETEIVIERIKVLWATFTWQHPKEVPATLSPMLLGTFRLWYSGEDTFQDRHVSTRLGANYPIGTVLKSNAAIEVSYGIDGMISGDALKLMGNVPYFARTPDTYRIFSSNFSFSAESGTEPFFYETPSKSLFALDKPPPSGAGLSHQSVFRNIFTTFNHPLVQRFEEQLHAGGMEALMDRLTEALPSVDDGSCGCGCGCGCGCACNVANCYLGYHIAGDTRAWGITQRMFDGEFQPNALSVDSAAYPLPTVEFAYATAFGVYNWELFFHAPMLIGSRLSQDLKFAEAMRWFHYVFDPRQALNSYEQTKRWVEDLPDAARYWTFLPFFANKDTTDSLLATLGLTENLSGQEREQSSALIAEWRRSPFNPHLIARQRISGYQKFVVMRYLDNLIAWADQLFRQDTFETINEATQLYILADDLLGGRPETIEPLTSAPKMTYRELQAKGIDDFSNAIVEVESMLVSNRPHLKDADLPGQSPTMPAIRSLALNSFYFTIPRNERLDRYWDTIKDRLFKIRNSMNIDGVKRRLALFEPPIDPALLVRAAAAGLDLGQVLAQLNSPLPCYRFGVWLQKATELTSELKGFGAALLAALEKKDAESLQLLRQGHELRMLELVRQVRQRQVTEAEANIKALELSLALAEERREFYQSRKKISEGEQSQIDKTVFATAAEITQGAFHTLAAVFAPIPDAKFGLVGPFPTAVTDVKIGRALSQAATAAAAGFGTVASLFRGQASLAGIRAGHDRRWDDWQLQLRLAQKEIKQLEQQIAVANIRLDITEKELENQEAQIEQSQEMLEFLKDKFTNRDLYQWMVTQLTRTYQQLYRLAYDAAKTAERCYEFELGVSGSTFVQFDYVDSLRQGLLAGEKLIYDLKRLDVAYLERNKRELEIQKPISLALFNGEQLQALRETGKCEFELPEVLFDLDFPGHYFRRIKAVRLTIPCVTGPHTSVSAKLTLLGSAYRKESAVDSSTYAYTGSDDERFVHDPIGIQGIATGRAQAESGVFELNFRDERYLPFEGAGTISRWKLELPTEIRQFDYNTISDVLIDLSYTARDGGGLAQSAANQALREALNRVLQLADQPEQAATGLVRVFSLRKEFPDVFERLLSQSDGTPVTMTLEPEHFPYAIRAAKRSLSVFTTGSGPANPVEGRIIPKLGTNLSSGATLTLNGTSANVEPNPDGVGLAWLSKGSDKLLDGWSPENWQLSKVGLTSDGVEDIVLSVKYTLDS